MDLWQLLYSLECTIPVSLQTFFYVTRSLRA